ncbi:MAG TPA: DUF167 domain-containing protein [Fimbriimonadaceae bacterium]|nr:DUF167 domain-containing protein [Fimbriimonadaceae bacterium]
MFLPRSSRPPPSGSSCLPASKRPSPLRRPPRSASVPEPACRLRVRVTPRAGANRIEQSGGAIKVWVTAPPSEGEANKAVVRVLADKLHIPPSRVTLVRGASAREKTFEIMGLSEAEVLARL